MVRSIIAKYCYRPNLTDTAVQTVLAQAKLLSAHWAM